MSASKIDEAEQKLRSALKFLDSKGVVNQKHFERLIILAADLRDSADRIRSRAMKFRHPGPPDNDNKTKSH